MDKINGKDILNTTAILANGILNNINGGINTYNEDIIRNVWNSSLQTVIESIQRINIMVDEYIYDGDLVALKIDSKEERFNLVKFMDRLDEIFLPVDAMKGHTGFEDNRFRFINTCSELGRDLLHKKAGSIISYPTRDNNGEYVFRRVEIMSFQRTPRSIITYENEVARDIELYKQEQKNNYQRNK